MTAKATLIDAPFRSENVEQVGTTTDPGSGQSTSVPIVIVVGGETVRPEATGFIVGMEYGSIDVLEFIVYCRIASCIFRAGSVNSYNMFGVYFNEIRVPVSVSATL